MKRPATLILAVLLMAAGCTDPNEDADELRAFVRSSEREPRGFTYRAVSSNLEYTITAKVEDELRYQMLLASDGRRLADYVVRDDALAVRLRDPGFGARLANVLGDQVVDAALKEGRWVVDPAGAPPLIRTEVTAQSDTSDDPFRDAREVLRFVERILGQARDIREFSLEDIEYRSTLDPWRYPVEKRDEVRYDLLRPRLPTSEAQTIQGSADIGPSHFRKTSVFVRGRRVRQVCSLVDVRGHEEFRELRERGLDSNPFLARLFERIQRKQTAVPIDERYVFVDLDYPEEPKVDLPPDAITGKLETFLTALGGAITAGVLRPKEDADSSDCRRRQAEADSR